MIKGFKLGIGQWEGGGHLKLLRQSSTRGWGPQARGSKVQAIMPIYAYVQILTGHAIAFFVITIKTNSKIMTKSI